MKKYFLLFLSLSIIGCSSAQIPAYLPDRKPYTKRYYTAYESTMAATRGAIKELGWEITQELDASVYDRNQVTDGDEKNSLLITNIRQTPMGLGTRYAKMNIFIRSRKNLSEIEIRYITITAFPFKNYETYSNDSAVQRVYDRIEAHLGTSPSQDPQP